MSRPESEKLDDRVAYDPMASDPVASDPAASDPAASDPAASDPQTSPVRDHSDRPAPTVRLPGRERAGARSHDQTPPDDRPGNSGGRGLKLARIRKGPDRVFRLAAVVSGFFITGLVIFIGIYLLAMALPSLRQNRANFLLSNEWSVSGSELAFGIAGMLWTTTLSSVVAMCIAVPIAMGIALFLTQYAPRRLAGPVGFMVDLLAAVPSIVYGLWGLKMLAPALQPFQRAISDGPLGRLGFFQQSATGTVFVASIVLAIMILPIVTAISRDVFAQTPQDHKEAALALGATRWEVIRTSVLPYGRSGVISAAMLGLGRALGETVAVMIILSAPAPGSRLDFSLFAGGETFASKIASSAAEFDTPSKTGAFIAAGLVLFVVTFVVNAIARIIADRGGAKS